MGTALGLLSFGMGAGGTLLGGDEMTGFPWSGIGKMIVYIWLPLAVVLVVVLPALGIDFFVFPHIGSWLFIAFMFYVGTQIGRGKWFPPKAS